MPRKQSGYLFEVSWEVCNKVGGIYTVITSKIPEAMQVYGDDYYLLGPDLKTNPEFEETDEACWAKIREGTAVKDIPCRFGRWKIPGEPKVILVNFAKKYNKDQLLYRIWEDYGVDSISGGWDYVEPVMFSYACGEVIETIYNIMVKQEKKTAVAQFHEWMTGAGLLGIKKLAPEVGTVFTTHATILGRSLAGSGVDIYTSMEHISPQREASAHNITAKYSMEVASAREADCFTTVSEITGAEAKSFLGKSPDVITPNGLDIDRIPDFTKDRPSALKVRERLLDAAARFLHKDFPPTTKILVISGRYEFHNKGIDIFLNALGRLDKEMANGDTILAYLFVIGGHTDLIPALQCEYSQLYCDYSKTESGAPPIATHRLQYEASDPILQTCSRLGLKNTAQNKVNVIFIPAYLNGHDGLINLPYYEALSGCDLGVFPSYYEPWGYTPAESAAYAVPTVTTDQAGFGIWVQQTGDHDGGVMLLKRLGQPLAAIEDNLHGIFEDVLTWEEQEMLERRRKARAVASRANWKDFFSFYRTAYEKALAAARVRRERPTPREEIPEKRHVFAGAASAQPHFRVFTAVAEIPKNIERLRELAYNIWWSWHPRALDLFATLDPKTWEEVGRNPVRMLETVSHELLQAASLNTSFTAFYAQIMRTYDDYMAEIREAACRLSTLEIKCSAPIAYFSTEYGLHETIPIYSGGLGTLSGDHLKTASDLNIPLVGVGLLYKNGFFKQVIDRNGIQIAEYPENDFSTLPVKIVQDDRGNDVQVTLDMPGRTLYASIWELKVGRVSLYLLSTDVPRNTAQDRKITDRLYAADQRTRFEQEVLLGIGGIKLLKKLGIKPRLYHINEGHSAFLIFSRITALMTEEGLNFDEACEVVRGSTVFTTHTPVEAGNERFPKDLMEYYFAPFIKRTGISWSRFWEMGQKESGDDKPFFMTILAMKHTHMTNAVSHVHGQVSRRLWRDVWKGFHETDIPIQEITNGIHTLSYMAPRMKEVLDVYLGIDWWKDLTDRDRWMKVRAIPNAMLWRLRYELKQKTIDFLIEQTSKHWVKYGYSKTWREELFSRMNPSALMIGFSRRFAPYKRADLIFSDLDRLDSIINNKTRPVHIIFAGKAHPNDDMGKGILKKVIDMCRDERFRGKLFFIEDYNIRVARHLVQGVDVWLNTPRRPFEASGTSGEKVVINGVLNLSVSDGWWCEGYDGTNGWTIGPVVRDYTEETANADEEDTRSLYSLIENTVVPLFYDREESGIPEKWMEMVKRSMETLVPRFNTERMLHEYYDKMYLPTAKREQAMAASSYKLAKELADWKRKIPMRFSSLKLLDVTVEGIHGDAVTVGQQLVVRTRVDAGKLDPGEILVELMIGKEDRRGFVGMPDCVPLELVNKSGDILTYSVQYTLRQNGTHAYGVRVLPYHKDLSSKNETGLILWG